MFSLLADHIENISRNNHIILFQKDENEENLIFSHNYIIILLVQLPNILCVILNF